MKMKACLLALVAFVALTIFIGCEGGWTTGGGVDSWNERYNAVNFSGVYRRAGAGYLVSDYTGVGTVTEVVGNTSGGQAGGSVPPGPAAKTEGPIAVNGTTASRTLQFVPIVKGTLNVAAGGLTLTDSDGDGNLTGSPKGFGTIDYSSGFLYMNFEGTLIANYTVTYIQQAPTTSPGVTNFANSGLLSKPPVVPGSVTLSVGTTYVLRDNGVGGLVGSGITGTIDYKTGAWTIDYGSTVVPQGTDISAAYQSYGGEGRGTTGLDIFTFTVHHEGQYLRIVDNTGAVYEGRMGSIRSSLGQDPTEGEAIGGTLIAQFNATGTSKAGYPVTMAGTFQGEVITSTEANQVLSSRKMIGTWIESGGKTGDIVGDAAPITIYSPGQPTTPATTTEGTTTEVVPAETTNI
ncbi:MAG: hypothetical protein KKC51_06840 [Verrucomicrobia bacterium]|nr:hypothetical protein [Verrucomicrobiota bacterium]